MNASNKKAFTITVVVLFLIMVGAVAYILYGPKGDKAPILPNENIPATSTPSIKEIPVVSEKEEGKYHTIDISYPSSDEAYQIKQYVEKSKADFLFIVPATEQQAALENVGEGRKYNLSITSKTVLTSSSVSYIIENYQFTGGAHGGTDRVTFVYDKDGKLITLQDILAGPDSLNKLSSLARTYFYNKFGSQVDKGSIDTGTEPKEENFSRFYITDDSVVFIFGQYSIGPYVLGIQEFPLKKSDAAGVLKNI